MATKRSKKTTSKAGAKARAVSPVVHNGKAKAPAKKARKDVKNPGVGRGKGGGRPPKYTKAEVDRLADDLEKWMRTDPEGKFPNILIQKWCFQRGIAPQRVAEFCDMTETRFPEVYGLLAAKRRYVLYEGQITEEYNGRGVQLVLQHEDGLLPKVDIRKHKDSEPGGSESFTIAVLPAVGDGF